jgi:MSHA pilin protein MshD
MLLLRKKQIGVTLVELIISIVVISVGLTGILIVITRNTRSSADPMVQHQSVAIAEAYLEEALLKDFTDPDGTNVGETRSTFDNVDDYNGLNNVGVIDQTGTAVASLSMYNVTMQTSSATALGTGVTAANTILVTVNVTGPNGATFTLSGYRTLY